MSRRRVVQTALAVAPTLAALAWPGTRAAAAAPAVHTPVADAYVRDGSYASTNYGSVTPLGVKTSSTGFNRRAYLSFDLAGLQATAVGSARLRIYAWLSEGTNIPTEAFPVAGTWAETGITWSNKPALGSSSVGRVTIQDSTPRWYELDVTDEVKRQLVGQTTISLALKNPTASTPLIYLNSREAAANRPELVVTDRWRSILYPADWRPGFSVGDLSLPDFSGAGYAGRVREIPTNPPGPIYDVTMAPYSADPTGLADATAAIRRAIDEAGAAGGGVVYLPEGTYAVATPAGEAAALRIISSRVVLRGAGPDKTRIYWNQTNVRHQSLIEVSPTSNKWSASAGSSLYVASDLEPTAVIPLRETPPFAPGDWVVIRGDVTTGFISDHGMTSYWDTTIPPLMYYRRITHVDQANKAITVDASTRYPLKTRDGARVYRVAPHVGEVGVEQLSLGAKENLKSGRGDADYGTPGTAAYEVHGSRMIFFRHAVDSWVKDVRTYRPSGNTRDWHIPSNGIELHEARFVTVQACHFKNPSYLGEGGNGYHYTQSANDSLIAGCIAERGRHNFSHKRMTASGSVVHQCTGIGGRLASDFHMYLSHSCLVDGFTAIGEFWQARNRERSGSPDHGHAATQCVFWNCVGKEPGSAGYLVWTDQYRHGYVVGTSGKETRVRTATSQLVPDQIRDYVEGVGRGGTLEPPSLYEDQLRKRLGR